MPRMTGQASFVRKRICGKKIGKLALPKLVPAPGPNAPTKLVTGYCREQPYPS